VHRQIWRQCNSIPFGDCWQNIPSKTGEPGNSIGKEIDFRIEISILFSYEAMTQGAHIGRLKVNYAGHLESTERNRS